MKDLDIKYFKKVMIEKIRKRKCKLLVLIVKVVKYIEGEKFVLEGSDEGVNGGKVVDDNFE